MFVFMKIKEDTFVGALVAAARQRCPADPIGWRRRLVLADAVEELRVLVEDAWFLPLPQSVAGFQKAGLEISGAQIIVRDAAQGHPHIPDVDVRLFGGRLLDPWRACVSWRSPWAAVALWPDLSAGPGISSYHAYPCLSPIPIL